MADRKRQPAEIVELAMKNAAEVIEAVMDGWQQPAPPQEELRAAFEAVLNGPPEGYIAAYQQWQAQYGEAEWRRQMAFMLRRLAREG